MRLIPTAVSGALRRPRAAAGLLGESIHAAGTAYGGTKLVVAALWTLRGFNRPTDIHKQTRLIAKGATQSTTTTPLLPCHYGRCLGCHAGGVGVAECEWSKFHPLNWRQNGIEARSEEGQKVPLQPRERGRF
jgi:hypothetical protein